MTNEQVQVAYEQGVEVIHIPTGFVCSIAAINIEEEGDTFIQIDDEQIFHHEDGSVTKRILEPIGLACRPEELANK